MDDRLFKSLEWRNIGPHRGGRCVAVAGHPTDTGTFYFGACAGGVFTTFHRILRLNLIIMDFGRRQQGKRRR